MSGDERWIRIGVEWAIFVAGFGLLVWLAIPHSGPGRPSDTTKELSRAKQVYIALKMYEGDHNGMRPDHERGLGFSNSSEVFRQLFPNYISREEFFYSRRSAWTPEPPDEKIGNRRTLSAGENCFAYIRNIPSDSAPDLPLIASAFGKGTPGIYGWDTKRKRSIPKGGAVVVFNDGSGRAIKIEEDGRTYIYGREVFKPAPDWLAPDQVPLNPEE